MLKKNHKLLRSEFPIVFSKGSMTHTKHFIIRRLPTESFDSMAFSVVVSKKVAKSAVVRNRTKRRVYNALKTLIQDMTSPSKGIIILKKNIESVSFGDIKEELASFLLK